VLAKRCTRCLETKPLECFHAAVKWPDGTMRRPQSRCKDCNRELNLERYHALRRNAPERLREAWRRKYRSLRADPERWAARNAYEREYYRERRSPNPTPERWLENRPTHEPLVDSAPVLAAVEASDLQHATIEHRAGIGSGTLRKAQDRPTMRASTAVAILDALGLDPVDCGI